LPFSVIIPLLLQFNLQWPTKLELGSLTVVYFLPHLNAGNQYSRVHRFDSPQSVLKNKNIAIMRASMTIACALSHLLVSYVLSYQCGQLESTSF